MGIGECIIAGAIFMVVLIVNHIGKVKVLGKDKVYLKELSLNDFNQKYQTSTEVFFVNECIMIYFAYLIAVCIPKNDNFMNLSGTTSIIIMVISGSLSNFIYRKIITLWNKHVDTKKKLFYVGENTRTWTILIVSFIAFAGLAYGDKISVQISYLAFSIIFGKLFWIENKRNNICKILRSFLSLPYCINLQYISILYVGILVLKAKYFKIHMLIPIIIVLLLFVIYLAIASTLYEVIKCKAYKNSNE